MLKKVVISISNNHMKGQGNEKAVIRLGGLKQNYTHSVITCSKLTMYTLEQGVK